MATGKELKKEMQREDRYCGYEYLKRANEWLSSVDFDLINKENFSRQYTLGESCTERNDKPNFSL